jgi:cation diffusion facilitator family transporter
MDFSTNVEPADDSIVMEEARRNREKGRAILFSILSNTTLVVLKVIVGMMTGLVSIVAEALHSANDLMAAVIAYFGVKKSLKPADAEHPYGHGKVEVITGGIENFLILLIGLGILYEGIKKFIEHTSSQLVEIGIAVMLASALVNYVVSKYLLRKGRELRSVGIELDGEHLRADVITSAGTAVALILLKITNIWWLDPLAAVCVGVWVIGIFVNLFGKLTQQMIDRGLNERDIAEIENILKSFSEVKAYHKIRTRQSGSTIFIDMHIKVDRDLNIEMAHDLTKRIEGKLKEKFLLTNILIHIEPLYDNLGAKAEKPDR